MEFIPGKLYRVFSPISMERCRDNRKIPAKECGCILMYLETVIIEGRVFFAEPKIIHRQIFLDENSEKVYAYYDNKLNSNPEKYLREAVK